MAPVYAHLHPHSTGITVLEKEKFSQSDACHSTLLFQHLHSDSHKKSVGRPRIPSLVPLRSNFEAFASPVGSLEIVRHRVLYCISHEAEDSSYGLWSKAPIDCIGRRQSLRTE